MAEREGDWQSLIETWQVWAVDQPLVGDVGLVVVVSSWLHIKIMKGQYLLVVPVSPVDRRVGNDVKVHDPDGNPLFVMTEHLYLADTDNFLHSEMALSGDEIADVQRILREMVDLPADPS